MRGPVQIIFPKGQYETIINNDEIINSSNNNNNNHSINDNNNNNTNTFYSWTPICRYRLVVLLFWIQVFKKTAAIVSSMNFRQLEGATWILEWLNHHKFERHREVFKFPSGHVFVLLSKLGNGDIYQGFSQVCLGNQAGFKLWIYAFPIVYGYTVYNY